MSGAMALADALIAEIAQRRDEAAALTASLVQIPSLNPPGAHYRDCCELVGARLARRGFDLHYVRAEGTAADSDAYPRWNLVARREGGRAGPVVHYSSHVDVVAVGAGWSVDPFGGLVRDGRVYGRGACDMKGGLASSVIALEALCDLRPDFAGAVELSATADEESGGWAGVAHLAQLGLIHADRVDHVVIPEPFNKNTISLGHRGVWWGELTIEGKVGHGSMPFLGDCAIRHMGAVLERLERRYVPALETLVSALPIVPEAARRPTLNLAAIHGGLDPLAKGAAPTPMVPDRCVLLFDRRYVPEEDPAAVEAGFRAEVAAIAQERGFAWSIEDVLRFEPAQCPESAATPQAAAWAIERVYGEKARFVASPGTYDHKHVLRLGGVEDCIAYGPGELALAHQSDEWVAIDELERAAAVMALTAMRLQAF